MSSKPRKLVSQMLEGDLFENIEAGVPPARFTSWTHNDFAVNRNFWTQQPRNQSEAIRVANLVCLSEVLMRKGVTHWLFGNSLRGAVDHGNLLPDHDDDLGINAEDWALWGEQLTAELERHGFFCIRENSEMASFLRDGRYIDLVFFRFRRFLCSYGNKRFPASAFLPVRYVQVSGHSIPVPQRSRLIIWWNLVVTPAMRRVSFLRLLTRPRLFASQSRKFLSRFLSRRSSLVAILPRSLTRLAGLELVEYSIERFLKLYLEPADSFNLWWRKMHLDLVTDGGRVLQLGAMFDYLAGKDLISFSEANVIETNMAEKFQEPISSNYFFWRSGNNYFLYPVIFGFRKNVVPYNRANDYISNSHGQPPLYSAGYYRHLERMTPKETVAFLRRNPIEVSEGAIVSGKHRALAVLGELLRGNRLRAVWVLEKKDFG